MADPAQEGPALHVCKGSDYTINVSMYTPFGVATAVLPLSTAQEVWEYLGKCVHEQSSAMETDLREVASDR